MAAEVDTYQYKVAELEAALKKAHDDMDRRGLEKEGVEAVRAADAKKKAEELKRPDQPKDFLALADDKAKGGDAAMGALMLSEHDMHDWLELLASGFSAGTA